MASDPTPLYSELLTCNYFHKNWNDSDYLLTYEITERLSYLCHRRTCLYRIRRTLFSSLNILNNYGFVPLYSPCLKFFFCLAFLTISTYVTVFCFTSTAMHSQTYRCIPPWKSLSHTRAIPIRDSLFQRLPGASKLPGFFFASKLIATKVARGKS